MIVRLNDAPVNNEGYEAPDDFNLADWEVVDVNRWLLTLRNPSTGERKQLRGRVAVPRPAPEDDPRLIYQTEGR